MATYVISDLHGHYDPFLDLLDQVSFSAADELYILGDIVDRGPKSIEMIDWVMNAADNVHMLRGNHEDMMLTLLKHEEVAAAGDMVASSIWASNPKDRTFFQGSIPWSWNGGKETYDRMLERDFQWRMDVLDWIENLAWYFYINVNGENFLMVHAGLRDSGKVRLTEDQDYTGTYEWIEFPQEIGIEKQDTQLLLWNRSFITEIEDDWLPCRTIVGHTPTPHVWRQLDELMEIVNREKMPFVKGQSGDITYVGRRIDIDCGNRGHKAMLRLDDMKEFYAAIE